MKEPFYIHCNPAADLVVSGEDAADFLQGQFTNDLRLPGESRVTYGLWLNQKGRVLADSFIWRESDGTFRLISEWSRGAVIRERLETYIIADDVTIDDRTGETTDWVLGGEAVADWIERLGIAVPPSGCYAAAEGAFLFRARLAGRGSWRLRVPRAREQAWQGKIAGVAGKACRAEANAVAARRMEDGVPAVPDELGPGDLPNEGGLEQEAISYTKGCYLGQEVMSRLKNLGRVRRRLHVVRGGMDQGVPLATSGLLAADRRVGDLRSVRLGTDGWIGLAMLHTDSVAIGQSLRVDGGSVESVHVDAVAEGRAW